MIWIAAAIFGAAVVALFAVARSRYGHLRLPEIPGALFILAAGKAYRAQLRAILAARERRREAFSHGGAPVGEVSRKPACVSGHAADPVIRGFCGPCYEQHRRNDTEAGR